tara:strand:+ start:2380 stop:3381 length:1002 start_codon:yes stop_codon:yes gene_type:complete
MEFHPSVDLVHTKETFDNNINTRNSKSKSILYTEKVFGEGLKNHTFLIFGGSISDPIGSVFSGLNGTWPDQFGERISKEKNSKITIINAAMGGTTSSQEVLRLITILHNKKANTAISLNGINETYFLDKNLYCDNDKVYGSRSTMRGLFKGRIKYQNKLLCRNICFIGIKSTNTYQLIDKIRSQLKKRIITSKNKKIQEKYNDVYKQNILKAVSIWEKNINFMNAISKNQGIDYFTILQPTYGLDMTLEDLEKAKQSTDKKIKSISYLVTPSYLQEINNLYSLLRLKCSQIKFCYDLSQDKAYNSNAYLFTDPRHPNYDGNKVLTEKIINIIN